MRRHMSLRALVVIVLLFAGIGAAETPNRVPILYYSFGKAPALALDWGFAAVVEYGGKGILFDTGNNASIFEHNVKALGVDLRNIDFVVISHRHADHTSGITYLLTVNPKVKIYVPDEPWGLFARGVKNDFYRKDPSLPAEMRYYGGHPPEILEAGTPWPNGNFVPVSSKTEVAPGHCTGEPEFAALKKAFGDHYLYAGAGTVIDLPGTAVSSASVASSAGR